MARVIEQAVKKPAGISVRLAGEKFTWKTSQPRAIFWARSRLVSSPARDQKVMPLGDWSLNIEEQGEVTGKPISGSWTPRQGSFKNRFYKSIRFIEFV